MALRLRRGTDAERLLITPLQGELIYTIDTKQLYAGDGTTAGGTLVSADAATTLESLTDTDLAGKTNGQVLSWNSSSGNWEPRSLVSNIADGVVEGSNYQINIISEDSTILVNSATNEFTGNLEGDVTGNLTGNVIGNITGSHIGDVRGSVFGDDSTLIIDGNTNALYGNLTGDVVGDLRGDVVGDLTGNILGNVQGNLTGDAFGNHSGSFLGSIAASGSLSGDLQGSVFGNDSTLLIDGNDSIIVGDIINDNTVTSALSAVTLQISGTGIVNGKAGIQIRTDGNADDEYSLFDIVGATESAVGSAVNFSRSRGTLASPTALQDEDEILAINYFGYDSDNSPQVAAVITCQVDGTPGSGSVPGTLALLTADSNGDINLGITLGADSVTRFWGPAKLYALADTTARDAAITAPEAGMMIYLTATNKAQVYNGSTWNDLF